MHESYRESSELYDAVFVTGFITIVIGRCVRNEDVEEDLWSECVEERSSNEQ